MHTFEAARDVIRYGMTLMGWGQSRNISGEIEKYLSHTFFHSLVASMKDYLVGTIFDGILTPPAFLIPTNP